MIQFFQKLAHDYLMWITLSLAAILSLFSSPRFADLDWSTLASLAALMLMVQLFEHLHLLENAAALLLGWAHSLRTLLFLLMVLAFVSAMLLTNDVAILTLVPLIAILSKKVTLPVPWLLTLVVIAANLGSILTPFGNPQNLFMLNHYHLSLGKFLTLSGPITLISFILLVLAVRFSTSAESLEFEDLPWKPLNRKRLSITLVTTGVIFLGVFGYISPLWGIVLAAICLAYWEPTRIAKVDYGLLLTFIGFFIIVGELGRLPIVLNFFETTLHHPTTVYFAGLATSQIISNVPATILLAHFTSHISALFLGVNLGGLGTLVASLANLLMFKQCQTYFKKQTGAFLRIFTLGNLGSLTVLACLGYLLLKLFYR